MRALNAIIQGREIEPSSGLGLQYGCYNGILSFVSGEPVIATPSTHYSSAVVQQLEKEMKSRAAQHETNPFTLEQAVENIQGMHEALVQEINLGYESSLVRDYCLLNGIMNPEDLKLEVEQLGRDFVEPLRDPDSREKALRQILGTEDLKSFFESHEIPERLCVWTSGQLGIYETTIMFYYGILAQACKNGHQASIVFRSSSSDNLPHDLMQYCVPQSSEQVFNWLTWSSQRRWDAPLLPKFLNLFDGTVQETTCGGIYFGSKTTLDTLSEVLQGTRGHFFYKDHFPVLIIGSDATPEQIEKAAEIALRFAYAHAGNSCLSLQNIYAHDSAYGQVSTHLLEARRRFRPQQRLYPAELVEEVAEIWQAISLLDPNIGRYGKIDPEKQPNHINTLLALGVPINAVDILATEVPARMLLVCPYSGPQSLRENLAQQLAASSSDKHIYAVAVGLSQAEREILCPFLEKNSHRASIVEPGDVAGTERITQYDWRELHCSQNMLANLFGVPAACYRQ
ncbi:hypothetical protein JW930_02540 [Candidatus Woesearchaeota archaeon]|nr:hypothetical protein [Candidatus Woesearchaeota archaeon]